MKFAVGYQLPEEGHESFIDVVRDYVDHVGEVYFAWVGQASGRAAVGVQRGYVDWTAQQRLEDDLRALRQMGLKLDVLFNANCYGGLAVSRHLAGQVASVIEHLGETVGGVEAVTTTSLTVASTVKIHFPDVEVRASVNMRIGTIEAMRYVSDLFDAFYIQRDVQRNLGYLRDVRAWCRANGKGLLMLANSGCLRFCPGQTFHDNMVAHDAEIDETVNIEGWTPHVCWNVYQDRARWPAILQATWVRPEDLHHYEGLVDVVKLATRMHSHPRMVLHAYANRRHEGNLLDLLEPGFGPIFAPYVIDNRRFPADFFEHISTCDGRCDRCQYCRRVFEQVLVKAE